MNRIIVILHDNLQNTNKVLNIVNTFATDTLANQIYVITHDTQEQWNKTFDNSACICQNICYPNDCDTEPKKRNWINQYFKTQNFNGFLHVITDKILINKNPLQFLNDIENAMDKLNYTVWFSTTTDLCNYVYDKYNPRLQIVLDKMEFSLLNLGKALLFTSHSNSAWICYDFNKITDDLLKFNDKFTIPMFWIIEFLARRRNTRLQNQLFYMNQYLTVESEHGVFKEESIGEDYSKEQLQKEDEIFKTMNINYHPDNNIDEILQQTYNILKEKSKI